MKIWAYWEPRSNVPAYLQLCVNTWKKFCPNAEVLILDNSNISDYIDLSYYGPELFSGKFSLPQIADALRAYLLYEHGGIWLDLDTVILDSSFFHEIDLKDYDCIFCGDPIHRNFSIATINSKKHSEVMKYWKEKCREKIKNFVIEKDFWAYLGNSILHDIVKTNKKVGIVEDVTKYHPENGIFGAVPVYSYQKFYFENNFTFNDFNTSALMLHNSWTPKKFKEMSQEQFVNSGCTLANILAKLNNIESRPELFIPGDEQNNIYRLIRQDGSIIYNPNINGLTVKFTSKNSVIEVYEPYGDFEDCSIICGSDSHITIKDGAYKKKQLTIDALAPCSNLVIGANFKCNLCKINFGGNSNANSSIDIGKECFFEGLDINLESQYVLYDVDSKLPINTNENVKIGNHVLIGSDCKIIGETNIADNTVILPSSVLLGDYFEENTLLGGKIANVIKNRIGWCEKRPYLKYKAHISHVGWVDYQSESSDIGYCDSNLSSKSNHIECISLSSTDKRFNLMYKVKIKNIGWTSFVKEGENAGTTGKGLPLQGFELKYDGENVLIEYRIFWSDGHSSEWVKNGTVVESNSLKIVGIQFRVKDLRDKS
jgi:acetyltransferase-like isoleucine patch superfamily enzyme